jgi:uncharacterized membrane protein YfcA
MEPAYLAALFVLGTATGFAAGLLGIGGGMLLVPFLTLLFTWRGYPSEHIVHMAIATSLATIMFTSVSSVRAHHKRGAVLWPVVAWLAPGILLGSLVGAQIAGRLPTFWLSTVFAVFVGFSAVQMLLDRKPKPSRELPRGAGMLGAGGIIGSSPRWSELVAASSRCRSWSGATSASTTPWPHRPRSGSRSPRRAPSATCWRVAARLRCRPEPWGSSTCRRCWRFPRPAC